MNIKDDYQELYKLVITHIMDNTEAENFLKYLMESLTVKEILGLTTYDYTCIYEGYQLQMNIYLYSDFEDFSYDFETEGLGMAQFYLDNYLNNYNKPTDIYIQLNSGRILNIDY